MSKDKLDPVSVLVSRLGWGKKQAKHFLSTADTQTIEKLKAGDLEGCTITLIRQKQAPLVDAESEE